MKLSRMTQTQVSAAYFKGEITKTQHDKRMREISTRRHAEDIAKKRMPSGGIVKGSHGGR